MAKNQFLLPSPYGTELTLFFLLVLPPSLPSLPSLLLLPLFLLLSHLLLSLYFLELHLLQSSCLLEQLEGVSYCKGMVNFSTVGGDNLYMMKMTFFKNFLRLTCFFRITSLQVIKEKLFWIDSFSLFPFICVFMLFNSLI